MEKKQKTSLTWQLILTMVVIVAGTVAMCWFFNTTFLEKYYMLNKQDSLIDGYDVINGASETGELNSSEFDVTFDNLCANGNIAVMIISSNRAIVRSSVNDNQVILMEFMNILFGDDRNQTEILQRSDNYVIQKQTDTRLSSEYMVLYGTLSNGNLILMRTAVESIRESAKISNQFLVYVGVLAIAISAIVTVFVSKRITTPISELTDISKRMTELDFDAKYVSKGHRKNEIDELGEHFNRLSCALESTISELKSANNELKQDIEKKTEIDEMRKEFLSNVSHELKTPLALIQGYAEGLTEGMAEDPESRDYYCEVIQDEAGKMNKMVKQLLTLTALEFGNDKPVMEQFDLVTLISGVLSSAKILLQQKEAQVIFDASEPVMVWADEFKIEEVVTNYTSNALNHLDGERKVEIKVLQEEDCVKVTVFNTGTPIPEEDIPNLWNKFYKVDKARTREYGGSGIGLSIVEATMKAHGKDYGVANVEGGVEFYFDVESADSESVQC